MTFILFGWLGILEYEWLWDWLGLWGLSRTIAEGSRNCCWLILTDYFCLRLDVKVGPDCYLWAGSPPNPPGTDLLNLLSSGKEKLRSSLLKCQFGVCHGSAWLSPLTLIPHRPRSLSPSQCCKMQNWQYLQNHSHPLSTWNTSISLLSHNLLLCPSVGPRPSHMKNCIHSD